MARSDVLLFVDTYNPFIMHLSYVVAFCKKDALFIAVRSAVANFCSVIQIQKPLLSQQGTKRPNRSHTIPRETFTSSV